LAGYDPYVSFPILIGSGWAGMCIVWEAGGWFSCYWDFPQRVESNAHKCISKQLPDSTIILIGATMDDEIIYVTLTYNLIDTLSSGLLGYGDYWGYDVNGDIAYVFYYDDSLNVYYQTTTDGVNWSGEQTYDMPWPEPYAQNLRALWTQAAVTDAGNPILIFDVLDATDRTYPFNSKVYVSTASGATPIQISDDAYDASHYPTIAAGGDYVVGLFQVHTDTNIDSLARHDVFYNWSTDNGTTWNIPINITGISSDRVGLPQISKRLDATTGEFFYCYGVNLVCDHDPLYHLWFDFEGLDPFAWYVGWEEIELGINEEKRMSNHKCQMPKLEVSPNPFRLSTIIKIQTPNSKNQLNLKIFDATGQLVKDFPLPTSHFSLPTSITWQGDEPAGIYFVHCENHSFSIVRKVVKLK
jgi:hypothetical protein